jgi:hypothetical protein
MRYLIAVVLCGGVLGCHRSGDHAAGSGYGVGIPRTAFYMGREPASRGESTQGVASPGEMYVGRVKEPPSEPILGQVGRVR